MITFSTVFVTLAWMFLQWRFTGDAIQLVATNPDLGSFPNGVWGGLGAAAVTVGAALLHVPLFLAVAVIYAVRFPAALVGYAVSVLASILAVWVGLRYTPVTAYVLFTLVALMSIPRDSGPRTSRALAVIGSSSWPWPGSGRRPARVRAVVDGGHARLTALISAGAAGRRRRPASPRTGRRSTGAGTGPWSPCRCPSNGGVDHEPQWWLNLQATPFAEIEVDGVRKIVR